jgi:hypothetical protein
VPAKAHRWTSLDAFRGLALFGMVAHHLATWTGGHVRERWIGFEDYAVTDLAAPMFAIGVGASAFLVGARIATSDAPLAAIGRAARRWGTVLLLGIAIDVAVGGGIDGGGVLYTLFAVGVLCTAVVAVGLRSSWAWWGIAAVSAVTAGQVLTNTETGLGVLSQLWSGPFPFLTYLAFTATGTAMAAAAGRRGEAALPLWRAAAATMALAWLASEVVPSSAPGGLWPPMRHPGDLAFSAWGIAASLAIWAGLRAVIRPDTKLADGLARAGQRTLLVYGLHYCIKLVLQYTDRLGTYDSHPEGLVTWAATAAICLAATVPRPTRIQPRAAQPT